MKLRNRFTALILALVMVFSLTISASAATAQTVTVKLSPNITVTLDGEAQAMTDVNGNPVYPVLYGGTTYLPVRAVGNMLGLDVGWDQATQTVLLTTSANAAPTTSGGKTLADAKPTDITVQINPNITVKLDGEAQEMKDTNGNPVYPMLYGGTTYLPVRAVSNMLMIDVSWNQATQTVTLDNSLGTLAVDDNGDAIVKGSTYEQLYRTLKHLNVPQSIIDLNLTASTKEASDRFKAEGEIVTMSVNLGNQSHIETPKTLGKDHIGYTWVELDYSTASEGYVRIKVNEHVTSGIQCTLQWHDENNASKRQRWNYVPTGKWDNIPLMGGSADYTIKISQFFNPQEYALPGEEFAKLSRPDLDAEFTAKVDDPDSMWLMSNVNANYENAPNTCAKALEITKNCKNDAEKITAVFEFVSNTLTYDHALVAQEEAEKKAGVNSVRDLNPDSILASKKGVCEHYAVLMTAMLRSIGVPCKLVTGGAKFDSKWGNHAWVVVNPKTGTLNIPGMGKDYASYDINDKPIDPTGWIRLDPTNAHSPNKTSNDNIYWTISYY